MFFLIFSQKTGFDITCKLFPNFPENRLFSGDNKTITIKLSTAEFAHR